MRVINKCIVMLIVFLTMLSLMHCSYAAGSGTEDSGTTGTDWTGIGSAIEEQASNAEGEKIVTSTQTVVGAIITVVRIVAVGVAIIMLVVLAMKYMISAPGDRADIKKHAVIYIVGAVVLFASSGILGIIQNFAGIIK